MKNISEMEWNSFVCFTVNKENCGEPAKQQRKGKNDYVVLFVGAALSSIYKLKLI